VEAEEGLLIQRQRDREARSILESMGVTLAVESQREVPTSITGEPVVGLPITPTFVPQIYEEFR
jgi:hypothetical protein